MLRALPYATRILDADVGANAVELTLTLDDQELRLRLCSPSETRAFARTRSFAVIHLDPLPSAAIRDQVLGFVRALARIDPGGVPLEVASRTQLDVVPSHSVAPHRLAPHTLGFETEKPDLIVPGGSWSRATFDASIQALAARGERFGSAVLVVTQACEMACTFCPVKDKQHEVHAQGGVDAHLRDLMHQLEQASKLGASNLELGGNDVLRFPHLHALLEHAHRLGYATISAQSPGQSLADWKFAEALSRSPLDVIEIPIYGHDAVHHDAITGVSGSFDALVQGLDHARALARPQIRLRTLALREGSLALEALLAFAKDRFGLVVSIGALRPNRVGERQHLNLAASFLELKALARRHPLQWETEGPLCVLPADRAHAMSALLTTRRPKLHLWDLGIRELSEDAHVKRDREREYLPRCEDCAVRGGCSGILKSDLARFGTEGLASIRHEAEAH